MNVYPLAPEQSVFFQEQGYIVVEGILTPEELTAARMAMDALVAEGDKHRVTGDAV